MGEQTIELTQVWLGLKPYVLIEADVDPADGELVLRVDAGGGAQEEIGALPLMMLGQLPDGPLITMLRDLRSEYLAAGFDDAIVVVDRVAGELGVTL
jgi:hypothetical protein